ncbi:MAG: hypothetical protein ACO1SV_24860 [Fimbriimonas sp.]
MGYEITVNIPDEVARQLRDEAVKRHTTLEAIVSERLAGPNESVSAQGEPDYAEIIRQANAAVTRPRTREEIDAYIDQLRSEW